MAKTKTVAQWIEAAQTYLSDGPPKESCHEAYVFVNRCEVKETKSGRCYLQRTTAIETIRANSKTELETKVGDFLLQDEVRILIKDLETNDRTLPRRTSNVTPELISGTADIYAPKDSFDEQPQGTQ